MKWPKNKYRVAMPEQRTFRGKLYASKAEMEYATVLWSLYASGEIKIIIEQPRLWLGVVENVYVPDFFVLDSDGPKFIDVKGMRTSAFNKNVKLWKNYGIGNLYILKKCGKKWSTEVIYGPKNRSPNVLPVDQL